MAKAIAEGTKSIEGVTVFLIKINKSTSPTILDSADTIAIESPSHNGYVTLEMLIFLANVKQAIDNRILRFSGKLGYSFGSYSLGWRCM